MGETGDFQNIKETINFKRLVGCGIVKDRHAVGAAGNIHASAPCTAICTSAVAFTSIHRFPMGEIERGGHCTAHATDHQVDGNTKPGTTDRRPGFDHEVVVGKGA